jgi:hypothetical protein
MTNWANKRPISFVYGIDYVIFEYDTCAMAPNSFEYV